MASILKIHAVCDQLADYQIKLFHVTGAFRGETTYSRMVDRLNLKGRRPTILASNAQFTGFCRGHRSPEWMTLLSTPFKAEIRAKKFLCFNRQHKGHRAYILAKFLESGLIKDAFFSFEGGFPNWIDDLTIYDWAPIIREQFVKHKSIFPLRLNITSERNNPVQLEADDIKYHSNSYFSIVNETIFYENGLNRGQLGNAHPGIFLTEKVARPIILKHPFILSCMPYSLKALHYLGFKTFHPFIDESYDSEEDDDKRLDMIVAETERLCKFTDEEWIQWQLNVSAIVEHNFNAILNLHPHDHLNVADYFKN